MCTGVRESVRIGTECVRKGTTSVAAIVYCILYQHSPVWVLEIENGTVVREEVVERNKQNLAEEVWVADDDQQGLGSADGDVKPLGVAKETDVVF